jgi:hypothetical protein
MPITDSKCSSTPFDWMWLSANNLEPPIPTITTIVIFVGLPCLSWQIWEWLGAVLIGTHVMLEQPWILDATSFHTNVIASATSNGIARGLFFPHGSFVPSCAISSTYMQPFDSHTRTGVSDKADAREWSRLYASFKLWHLHTSVLSRSPLTLMCVCTCMYMYAH